MVHSARFVAKRRLVLLLAAHVYVICRNSQKSCPIATSTAQIELVLRVSTMEAFASDETPVRRRLRSGR